MWTLEMMSIGSSRTYRESTKDEIALLLYLLNLSLHIQSAHFFISLTFVVVARLSSVFVCKSG